MKPDRWLLPVVFLLLVLAMPADTPFFLPDRINAVPDTEVAAVLTAAIRDGKAGTMT